MLEGQLEGLHATIQGRCYDRPPLPVLIPSRGSFRVDSCLCGSILSLFPH